MSEAAIKNRRSLNLVGLSAMDIRTQKPSGGYWDFTREADRQEALKFQDEHEPDWVIGSPPCTDWSSWNVGINHKKMSPEEVARRMAEARLHLKFVVRLYRRQLAAGRHFLHGHPAGATSWAEPYMKKLLANKEVQCTISHQCEYGLVSASPEGVLLPVKKPTRWMTSSKRMLARLSRRCSGHVHQRLEGGRAAAAAYYPDDLLLAILRGMRDESDHSSGMFFNDDATDTMVTHVSSDGVVAHIGIDGIAHVDESMESVSAQSESPWL